MSIYTSVKTKGSDELVAKFLASGGKITSAPTGARKKHFTGFSSTQIFKGHRRAAWTGR